jgi:hypothetical protein
LLDDDGIMLCDISGECMLLDDDGIMLSDISGKWLLLDADMSHNMMPSSSSNYFPDMSDYVMPSASRSNHFPDMSDCPTYQGNNCSSMMKA